MRSFILGLLLCAGCGPADGPAVLPAATYDPEAMARAALKEYDRDGSGAIEGPELDACPGLKAALGGFDLNRDKKVTADELTARFEAYRASNASTVAAAVTVTLNGAPLAGAQVTFTPEACMGWTKKDAAGKTEADGVVRTFSVDGRESIGLQPGLYRIRVSKLDPSGKELVPDRYNSQSPLGIEVFGGRGGGAVTLALTSR